MANVKISQLPNTGTPSATGLIPIVQDGTTYHASAEDIVALVTSTDVVDALGYTPVNPSVLADYVPEARTITINGTTQDLSTNRTWTIPSGAATIDLTSSAGASVGDLLAVNNSGLAINIEGSNITPTFVDYGAQNTNMYGSLGSANEMVLVNPNDPTQIVNIFVDGSNQIIVSLTMVNGTEMYNATTIGNIPLTAVSGYTYFNAKWDPFNKNRFLLIYLDGTTIYGQYVKIVNPYSDPNLGLIGSAFPIYSGAYNSKVIDFQFSAKISNLIAIGFADSSTVYPTVMSCSIVFNSGMFSTYTSIPQTIGLNPYYGSPATSFFELARLEGEDVFGYQYSYFNGTGNVVEFAIFTFPAFVSETIVNPLTVGTTQVVIPQTNDANSVSARFISSTKFLCSGYNNIPSMVYAVGEFAGLAINTGSLSVSTVAGDFGVNQSVVQLPVNKNYFMTYFRDSSITVKGQFSVINGTVITTLGTIDIIGNSVPPDNVSVSNFSARNSAFVKSIDGVGYLYMFVSNFNNNQWYTKLVPVTYINKLFSTKTLIGIAQTSASMGGVVEVLPFGSVDTNQSGLTAAVAYYLQDDGTITTNVTPTLLGTGLSATTIKTASYPQL